MQKNTAATHSQTHSHKNSTAPAKNGTTPKPVANDASSSPALANDTEPGLLELFLSELRDIYWAENQLVMALPKMKAASTSKKLAKAISDHLEQTKGHVTRLEKVFQLLGQQPRAKKCDAMEGLSKEGEAVIESTMPGSATRDVGIIIASQKVEHYEIAAYGGLAQLARTMGLEDAVALLEQTLAEEKASDSLLTDIAENDINYQASKED